MPGVATQTSATLAAQHSTLARRTSSRAEHGDDGFANLLDSHASATDRAPRPDNTDRPVHVKEADHPAKNASAADAGPREPFQAPDKPKSLKITEVSEKLSEVIDPSVAKDAKIADPAVPQDDSDAAKTTDDAKTTDGAKTADAVVAALTPAAEPAKVEADPTPQPAANVADSTTSGIAPQPAVVAAVPVLADPTAGTGTGQVSSAATREIGQVTGLTTKANNGAVAAKTPVAGPVEAKPPETAGIAGDQPQSPAIKTATETAPTDAPDAAPETASKLPHGVAEAAQPRPAMPDDKPVATSSRAEIAAPPVDAAAPSSAATLQAAAQVSPPHPSIGQTSVAQPVTAAQPAATAAAAVPIAGLPIEIAASAKAGINSFDIRLDPVDLGRIQVHLDVDRSGQVHSHITADNAQTLDLLRRDAPQLERALQDAGFKTGDGAMQFSLRDQSLAQQQNQSGGNPSDAHQRVVVPDDDMAPVMAVQGYGRLAGLDSGIDIRV